MNASCWCLGTLLSGSPQFVIHPDSLRPLAFADLDLAHAVAALLALRGFGAAGPTFPPAGVELELVESEEEAAAIVDRLVDDLEEHRRRKRGEADAN